MKAMVLAGIRKIEIVEKPAPTVQRPTDVLLRVIRVGICGSDVHYYTQGRIGDQVVRFPFTIGHECSAVVEAVGEQVTRVKPGDLVAVEPTIFCGACDQCRLRQFNTCRNQRFLGCPGQVEGCLCDLLVMPEACCIGAGGLSEDQAALAEPLTIGLYASRLAGELAGRRIGILGAGPIGLSVLLAAQVAGAATIYVTDPLDYRLKVAREQGATWIGNPDRMDVVKEIGKQEPLQLDVVFECCGQQAAFDQAVELCKPMGRLVFVGIPETDQVSFAVHTARRKGLTFINVRRQNECAESVIELIRGGRVKPQFMITHRFRLDRVADAFELLADCRDGIIKAVIDME
jgi:L-iditol 2-dehydrogenase